MPKNIQKEKNINNENQNLKNFYDSINLRIKGIDQKNGVFLSITSFLLAALGLFISWNTLPNWSVISIILFSCLAILSFILSIVPIFWNRKEKNRNSPIYIPVFKKMTNLEITQRFKANSSQEDYVVQINRVKKLLAYKYTTLWLGTIFISVALILFMVSCIIAFV